jgi:hypothetical protein
MAPVSIASGAAARIQYLFPNLDESNSARQPISADLKFGNRSNALDYWSDASETR